MNESRDMFGSNEGIGEIFNNCVWLKGWKRF